MRNPSTLTAFVAASAVAILGAGSAFAAPTPSGPPVALTSPGHSAAAPASELQTFPAPPQAPKSPVFEAVNRAAQGLIEAVQRDLGLSPEKFFLEALTAEKLATMAGSFAADFVKSFGGVWIDDNGNGVVGVAPGDTAGELKKIATDAGFGTKDVAKSEQGLIAQLRQVTRIVEGLDPELKQRVTGTSLDLENNTVVVDTDGGEVAVIGAITSILKDLALVRSDNAPLGENSTTPSSFGSADPDHTVSGTPNESGLVDGKQAGSAVGTDAEPLSKFIRILGAFTGATGSITDGMGALIADPETNGAGPANPPKVNSRDIPDRDGPVVAGTAFDVPDNGVFQCSTGFNGTVDGKPVNITAAHCAGEDGRSAQFPNGQQFGKFRETTLAEFDTALIEIDESFHTRFNNNLIGLGNGRTQEITGSATAIQGQKVCKMGSRSGFTCGEITSVGAPIDVSGTRTIVDGFTASICALPGDSGGPVFAGDKAIGIASASNVANAIDCQDAAKITSAYGGAPRLSAVSVDNVLAAHDGLSLNTTSTPRLAGSEPAETLPIAAR